jgi:pimeloyl-ACP methyl ester carboxylesterase
VGHHGSRGGALTRRSITVGGRAGSYLEAGAGRPVVLVHGAGSRAAVWARQLEGLADAARLLAVDLPGHGLTGGRGCLAVAEYADWVRGVCDGAGVATAVVVGHSMGGAIAQTLALTHPERVAGLVLVGTGARLRVLPRVLALFRDDPPAGASLVGSLSYSPRTAPGTVVEAERGLTETPAPVTLGDFLACDRFDVMATIGTLRVPTLVLVGRDDRLTPPKYARYLAGTIPGARLIEVADAGHFPQLEQPEAVNAALRAFLAALT